MQILVRSLTLSGVMIFDGVSLCALLVVSVSACNISLWNCYDFMKNLIIWMKVG